MITCCESKIVQLKWDNQLESKMCLGADYLNIFYKRAVTISKNEMICRKIFSFYSITSFGLSGRGYRKKEGVKYGEINSGQNGQKKRMFWDPGLTENDTTKHINSEHKKRKGKHMCWSHSPKAITGKMEQRWMRTSFGPEYSSDDAGDGPMGKTVGKKNKEKAKRMQSKESWHEMAAKRQASLPKAPVREVDE